MTYVVNEKCIKCKYTDCVEVCPVDCFYEGENMLVIHPDECIDCGVCEPECPVTRSSPTLSPTWKSGWSSTASIRRPGQILPPRSRPFLKRRPQRTKPISLKNIFLQIPDPGTDFAPQRAA